MLKEKMIAVISAVNDEVAERRELINMIAVCLLTRKNLFILGDTGAAKSYAINRFRRRILGAKQFERLISKQSDEEQLFGRLDLGSLIPGNVAEEVLEQDSVYQSLQKGLEAARQSLTGSPAPEKLRQLGEMADLTASYRKALAELYGNDPHIKTKGKIPESHIVFIDELFKANDGILNSLLTALNERRYTNEGVTVDIPTISFFTASNEIPNFNDPAESILRPLYDRLELKLYVKYIEDRDTRLSMLAKKQAEDKEAPLTGPTITLEELCEMQREVSAVRVPAAVNELMDDILIESRRQGIHVSDRKYFGYYPIVQAHAWLCGRDEAAGTDLTILRNYLWTTPDELPKISQVLTRLCENPLGGKISEIRKAVVDVTARFDQNPDGKVVRALQRFRTEAVEIYRKITGLRSYAQNDTETAQVDGLLEELEKASQKAHAATNLTYIPMNELEALIGPGGQS